MKYITLHNWIRKRIRKRTTCYLCRQKKKLDLANRSHLYKEEVSDWFWLCRSCHMKYDMTSERELKRFSSRKGYRHSEETRQKMSISKKGKPCPWMIGNSYGFKRGVPRTKEWKNRMSTLMSGENNPWFGKKHTTESIQKMKTGEYKKCPVCNRLFYQQKSRLYRPTCSKICGYINKSINSKKKYATQ